MASGGVASDLGEVVQPGKRERVASGGAKRPAGATTCPSSRPAATRADPAQMIAATEWLRIIQ
jgi:hypothetical protein